MSFINYCFILLIINYINNINGDNGCAFVGLNVSVTGTETFDFMFGYPMNICGGFTANAIQPNTHNSLQFVCKFDGNTTNPYILYYTSSDCSNDVLLEQEIEVGYHFGFRNTEFIVKDYNCEGSTCTTIDVSFYFSNSQICATNNDNYFKASAVVNKCLYSNTDKSEPYSFELDCDSDSIYGTFYDQSNSCQGHNYLGAVSNEQCIKPKSTSPYINDRLYITVQCNDKLSTWIIVIIVVGSIILCIILIIIYRKCKKCKTNSDDQQTLLQNQTEGQQQQQQKFVF